MEKNEEDLYNIEKYKDEDLYDMLDINNPTDRELETKIVIMINKYSEMEGQDAKNLKKFFERVYDHFFDEEEDEDRVIELDEDNIEGFEGMDKKTSSQKDTFSDYKNVFGKNEVTDQTEADKKLLQTTPLFYGASKLNPLLKETQKRVLQLDSQFRNYDNYPHSTDYIINLSEQLHNVVSLRLHSVSIPYTWYNVSNVYDANYFKLLGNVDGIKGVYDLTFNIPAGTYNTVQLMDAINDSISEVAANNTDIEFGTTGVSYNEITSKITFTLDIQQVYNETNYYIYFNYYTSPFDSSGSTFVKPPHSPQTQTMRQLSIPGFLGFGNLVIPKYSNSNFVQSQSFTEVDNTYPMESIYSFYEYCYNVTGKKTLMPPSPPTPPIEYNSFDPNQMFYLVINDASNNVVGNNFFTIQTFDGPDPYDVSSTIINTFNIEFGDVSGFYTRATLLEAINRSLSQSEFLSSNASLNQIDISYNEINGTGVTNVVTMQRFQLRTLLNRKTTKKQRNAKQIVLFPNETDVYNGLSPTVKLNWPGPIWTGQSSCFMFYEDNKFWQSNAVPSETGHLRTKYLLESNPTMTLRCIKPEYDNAANNRTIQIPTAAEAGFPSGYKLMDYFGVYSYDNVYNEKIYQFSEINTRFTTINNSLNNGYVDVQAFYDVGRARCRVQVDLNTYFNETMYTFDFSNFFLNDIDGSGNALGVFTLTNDTSYNYVNGINTDQPTGTGIQVTSTTMNIPSGSNGSVNAIHNNTNSFNSTDFPFSITSQNNRIVVDVGLDSSGNTIPGLANVKTAWGSGYTVYIPEKIYAQPYLLVNAINTAFAQIQGETDPSGNPLYGLNMSQSKFYMSNVDGSTEYNWVLKLIVSNNLSENDYQLEFADSKTDYENPWIDANENDRYSLDSSGNLVTSTESALTGTSWNAFLGFTDVSYSLIPPSTLNSFGVNRTGPTGTEIVASRDIMNDLSGSIFIYESDIAADASGTVNYYQNNIISFLPQTNVKGLIDASGIKRLEIAIEGGIYTYYGLLNALNNQLQLVPETVGSIIYNYFSNTNDTDYTVFQMNINKVYTAQDYILEFYNEEEVAISDKVRNITSSNSFQAITWDVTLGWMLGYRSFPTINLNATDVSNSQYVDIQSYSLDVSTGIITLIGDTGLDLYLYKTLYLILDDFSQNHLNDGLITGVRDNPLANKPSYSSSATKVCNPITKRDQTSIFSASQPGMGLTENQLYAANSIAENNFVRQTTRLYSDPPYVKDMFATIPIKVSSLKQGDLFTEYGGTLQDNARMYFGPVNISKMNIKLLNDHGDVIDLNGNNWQFSLVFEYLYNLKGI